MFAILFTLLSLQSVLFILIGFRYLWIDAKKAEKELE